MKGGAAPQEGGARGGLAQGRWRRFGPARSSPPPMPLPVVLRGSCRPVQELAPLCQAAAASSAGTAGLGGSLPAAPLAAAPPLQRPVSLPARPLLSLGLLQIMLGCSLLALKFGAMWLSSAPLVQNARPVWAGCSVSHRPGQPARCRTRPDGGVWGGGGALLPDPAEGWETRRAVFPG